jgi:dihydroxy-acid dehydratase
MGIANTWIGTMPCDFLLRDLAQDVARGIREAGGTPMEFNTMRSATGSRWGRRG